MTDLFTKLMLAGACLFAFAWAVVAQRRLVRKMADAYLRLSHVQRTLVLLAMIICTVYAQKPSMNIVEGVSNTNDVTNVQSTNGVDIAEGTNEVGGVALNAPQPTINGASLLGGFGAMGTSRPTITACDIGRGCRLDSVTTNDAISYEAPDTATEVGTWHLTGAYDDVVRADLREFRFPLGTNLCSYLWAHTWGTARPQLRIFHSPFSIFHSNEISAVGTPMSALPGVSRFWTAPTTNGTFLLTWENFVVGRLPAPATRDASGTVNAQIELKRSGDFVSRSNNVESVYRRINPDDWDDDGWCNADDPSPYEAADEDGFGPHQDLSFIVHSNNYYWVDLVVSNANALVTFESELPSELPNPQFIARAGATNRVVLLLGKPYEVKCAQPIVCVESSHDDVDVTERGEDGLDVCRPVACEFVSMPLLMASPRGHGLLGLGGGGTTISLSPEPEGYEVSLGDCCCMTQVGGGLPYFYCMGNCGCGGCSSGDISVAYDGTVLAFPGYSCPCSHEPNPGGDDPQGDPEGPSVSANFSRDAVIFEEAYTNMPGVVVPRRSTDVEVSYYVNGGTNGGTYAFTLVNGAKLLQVDGGTLPVTGHVAAAESKVVTARYEGRVASGREDDIIAKAEFTEDETGQTLTDTYSRLTAVKMELVARRTALQNSCQQRHVYGVAEDVRLKHYPLSANPTWNVRINGDVAMDSPFYDAGTGFMCSVVSGTGEVAINISDVSLSTSIQVVEPQIEVRNVRANDVFSEEAKHIDPSLQDVDPVMGEAGHLLLFLDRYVSPYYVSFEGLMFLEIPDESHNCPHDPSGYYADENKGGPLSHTGLSGAGKWNNTNSQAFFGTDAAGRRDGYSMPWTEGWKSWPIPMGWGFGLDVRGQFQTNPTSQTFTLHANGTFRIEKFGHWAERSTLGLIWVDGSLQFNPWPW